VVDLVDVDTASGYAEYTGTVTATSATSELEFFGRQDLDFYYLDDVSLTDSTSSVPEPYSWALVFSGLLACAGVRRLGLSRLATTAA
jgi:hypothetical protein